jgi:hypothetical protein
LHALRGARLAHRPAMRFLTGLLLFATGCSLYTHGGDDCALYETAPGQAMRNPYTGECHVEQSVCDPCTPCAADSAKPAPDGRAVCGGPCEALSETRCFDAKGCHAAYEADPRGSGVAFVGCWAVAISDTQPIDACSQLDAQSCPYRDDCATWYAELDRGGRLFDHCASEAARDSCEPGTCGAPPPCPSSSVATTRNGCYTGRCMPRDQCPTAACADLTSEAQCTLHTECEPRYRGDDCTCTPSSCTCELRTFEQCQDAPH